MRGNPATLLVGRGRQSLAIAENRCEAGRRALTSDVQKVASFSRQSDAGRLVFMARATLNGIQHRRKAGDNDNHGQGCRVGEEQQDDQGNGGR